MRLFETIKETVTVGQATEYYGMKIGRNNMICCPFHNASLKSQTQDLTRQVKEATSNSIRKKMDDARLRADYENLQKLMGRIPPEILELAKRGQLTHSDRER